MGALHQPVVDGLNESAYARGSFETFEESSAGIAIVRAIRTFVVCDVAFVPIVTAFVRRNELSVEIGVAF